mgnify:FL=1
MPVDSMEVSPTPVQTPSGAAPQIVAAPQVAAPPVPVPQAQAVAVRPKDGTISIVFTVLLLGVVISILVWQVIRMDERLMLLERAASQARPEARPTGIWKPEVAEEEGGLEDADDGDDLVLEENRAKEDEDPITLCEEDDEEAPPTSVS